MGKQGSVVGAMLGRMGSALLEGAFFVVLMIALAAVLLAYQVDTVHTVSVGGDTDRLYVADFHERESSSDGVVFRWSTGESTVIFPAVGSQGRWLALRLHGWRPPGVAAPEVGIAVNGQLLGRVVVEPGWREYRLWVPGTIPGDTVRVTLQTNPFVPAEAGAGADVRPLGVAVGQVSLIPLQAGWVGGWPVLGQLGWVLLFAVGLYLALAAVGLFPWGAAAVSGVAAVAVGYLLAYHRLWMTIDTHRLAVITLLGLALLPLLGGLFVRVFRWGGVSFGEREMQILLAIFLVSFLIKAGALVYPHSVAWDLRLQLHWASWIWDGRLPELYGTDSPLHERTMPAEWGQDKPLIPYSPFYHIVASSFFLLPWRPYDTANVLSVLLDVTRPFLIYFLARRLGLSGRTGVWAGLLYALLPATFLLHAWGNTPTTMGLWWTFAATCYMVGAWERLNRPRTWIGLVLFLLGALLFYTPLAVFMGLYMAILLLGLALDGRRLSVRPLRPLLLALLAAIGLAAAVYYGQFIGPILTETIPRLLDSARQGGTALGTEPVSWPEYLRSHWVRLGSVSDGRGLLWPILLALGSLLTGWRHAESSPEQRPLRRWVLIAWFGTASFFFLVGYRVDMVDKEFWFVLPALALCAAVTLEWLWQRLRAGRVVAVSLCLYIGSSALVYWFTRLVTIRQEWTAADAEIVGGGIVRWGVALLRALGWG